MSESIRDFGVRMRALRAGRTYWEQDRLECAEARARAAEHERRIAKQKEFGQSYGLTEESLNAAMAATRATHGRPIHMISGPMRPITEAERDTMVSALQAVEDELFAS